MRRMRYRAILICTIISWTLVFTSCTNQSATTPPASPEPQAVPPANAESEDYIEAQYEIKDRVANLSCSTVTGKIKHYVYIFDKPVDAWFSEIDEVILSIGGGDYNYPPHNTNTHDASGEPLYYFMGNVTRFSYTAVPGGNDIDANYYLHIEPCTEGETVTVTFRVYEN